MVKNTNKKIYLKILVENVLNYKYNDFEIYLTRELKMSNEKKLSVQISEDTKLKLEIMAKSKRMNLIPFVSELLDKATSSIKLEDKSK